MIYKSKYLDSSLIKDPSIENLDLSIALIRKTFLKNFVQKWTTHVCEIEKCKTALNLDGNHKVNRLTCLFDRLCLQTDEITGYYLFLFN